MTNLNRLSHWDRSTTRRRGITMIELLTVIAIIGVLVAMMGPAIQNAREAARSADCLNRTRQLALAMHQHLGVHRYLPTNGGRSRKGIEPLPRGLTTTPETIEYATGGIYYWGVGQPGLSVERQSGSWIYAIMPFFEEQAAYSVIDTAHRPQAVVCPSRIERRPSRVVDDVHGRYRGGDFVWAKTDRAGNAEIITKRPKATKLSAIRGGTSGTILIGEKAFHPLFQPDTSWLYDESFYLGGSRGTTRALPALMDDGPDLRFKQAWGSPHGGRSCFAMADGSCRWITHSIEETVFEDLLTPGMVTK